MKTILKLLIAGILSLNIVLNVASATTGAGGDGDSGGTIKVTVSEDLKPLYDGCKTEGEGDDAKYICEVPKGFGAIKIMMGSIIKYFTFIAGLGAVLFIVVNGVLYSMSGINDSMKTDAKNRITKTLLGLIVLLLSGVILNLIAPWVYKL